MSKRSKELFENWKPILPDKGSFRMSVRMWYGKNETMKYRYINFISREQFRAWLVANEAKIYSIVNIAS